jgi:predicted transcriptional regulator
MPKILTWYSQMKEVELIDNVKTGAACRKHRESTGHSLRDVAEKMKISPSYLSDLERGNRNWSHALHDSFLIACIGDQKGGDV